MSVATKLHSPVCEPRAILGPGGNRVKVPEDPKRKGEALKKPQQRPRKPTVVVSEVPQSVVRSNGSVDSSCSSDSSSSGSLAKPVSSKKTTPAPVRRKGLKPVKVVPDGVEVVAPTTRISGPPKRCDWITPNSDPIYTSFHDEEWGVPIHDDRKLFELLVFSQALAELTWPAILNKRDTFRKLFDNFDPSSVAQFNEKKLLSLKVNGNLLLSEPKLRAIVENAKQILKRTDILPFPISKTKPTTTLLNVKLLTSTLVAFIVGIATSILIAVIIASNLEIKNGAQKRGSTGVWFLQQLLLVLREPKPIKNGFRYARQVPVKSPKADVISKDMLQRGFRCVGPTVIYSFMQVAGIVNGHLLSCFRYEECKINVEKVSKPKTDEESAILTEALEMTSLSI